MELSKEQVGLPSGLSQQHTNEALHEPGRTELSRVAFGGAPVLDLAGLRNYSGVAPKATHPL